MENLGQEKISKVKSKFEKEHTKISVFLRFDQIEYLNKEHVEPKGSNMSLVVRKAVGAVGAVEMTMMKKIPNVRMSHVLHLQQKVIQVRKTTVSVPVVVLHSL